MRKYLCILLALLLLLAFAACGAEPDETKPSEPETEPTVWTEADLQQMFEGYAEDGWTLIGCAVTDGSDYGIVGVVQYTTGDDDGCKFDFLRDGQPLSVGIEAEPVIPGGALRYEGNNRISCRLYAPEGAYTCSIAYAVTDGEINFTVTD